MKKYILMFCAIFAIALGATFPVFAAEEISSVEISEIPVMEVGASIQDSTAVYQAPEGCIVESRWYIWNAEEETYILAEENTFTETDIYYFSLAVSVEEGYTFAEDFHFTYAEGLNPESAIVWNQNSEEDGIHWFFDMPAVTFAAPVQQIDITTPEAKAGTVASIDEILIYVDGEVVDNEKFNIEADWYCVTDDEIITGKTFEADKVYQLIVNITAIDSYSFSDDTYLMHNGEEGIFFSYPNKVEFFKDFSLLPPIERIELTGLTALQAGDAPVTTLTIENGIENCEVFVLWYDENGDELQDQELKEDYAYTVQVEVNLYGDEPLSENFVYVIDGIEYEPTELSTETKQAWLNREYRLGEMPEGGMPLYIAGIAAAIIAVTTIVGIIVAICSPKKKLKKRKKKK